MKKHEKKLLVRSVVALILMLVFGFIAVYLEARTGVVKEELVSKLEELISYSTSPSCTSGMKLFIKRIKNWEYSE